MRPTLKTITLKIPLETASVLRSLISGAVGGDFTTNRARILLDKLMLQIDEHADVPADEFEVKWEGHAVLQKRRTKRRRKPKAR